ncbi:cobalt transporter [Microbacterium nanhaiense]|uniref:Cobalt transporter n=1 Tax=Microbacterium nanhaiense TaxID=1301026 RepID=A0ABQ2MYJ6_9MICO|nr:cation transporter [Microbacterium nanhaiense]GGO60237.1 cobalt transporter [Microbacterium nanhaiense]
MNATARHQFGRTDLPEEQQRALRSAVRWEIFTLCYSAVTIFLVAIVVGNSQSMRTAWVEDMLSTLPQIVFLIALPMVRKRPTTQHPYGRHRAMSIGHFVAGVALLTIGGALAIESALGLIRLEHPSIGTVNLFGHTIWLGWLMIAVMSVIVVGPFFYGPAKVRAARTLHNKVLYADGDMATADWQTNAASVIGVLGVGMGLWWLDGAAAIFISIGIISDGLRNTRVALSDLMDQRALRFDSTAPHSDIATILGTLHALPWVADAGVRARDMGQVLHIEAFIVPKEAGAGTERIAEASERIAETSWQVQDVVVTLCDEIPAEVTERITRAS